MKPTNPDNYDQEDINMAFDHFVAQGQNIVSKYMEERFPMLPCPTVEVRPGSVYWKMVKVTPDNALDGLDYVSSQKEYVYGFVRKSDGAIFKAASSKAPYTKGASAIRGYVTDEWAASTLTAHGVIYAQ
tara:strand:- start:221 stop:607 length:387 start_codon:yes stop_codon:yes gene_type:complete